MAAIVANTSAAQRTLYAALELEPGASPAEVKAAYDRVQAKIKVAGGSSSEEKAKLVSNAYVILVDPKKRAVYDEYGDKAWELLNNPYTDAMFQSMESHTLIKVAIIFLIILTVVLFAQTIIIGLKIDGSIGGRWVNLLIPVWFFDGVLGVVLIYLFYNSVKAWNYKTYELEGLTEAQIKQTRTEQIVVQVYYWMYIGWTVCVGWGLDRPERAYWGVYTGFAILAEVVGLVATLPKCFPDVIRSKLESMTGEYPRNCTTILLVIVAFISAGWRIPFWFMLGLNISFVNAKMSYYIVCIPIYLGLLATWEYFYMYASQKSTSKMQAMLALVPVAFLQLLFFISVFLLCGKLHGAGRSFTDCFIPIFLAELILICISIGGFVAFKMYDKEMQMMKRVKDYAQPTGAGGVAGAIEAASAAGTRVQMTVMGQQQQKEQPAVALA